VRRRQTGSGGIGAKSQRKPIGRGGADQRRPAHLHRPNCLGRIGRGGEPEGGANLRQTRLIEDLDPIATWRGTQRAQVRSLHVVSAGRIFERDCSNASLFVARLPYLHFG
jgi:hypothetical protein